LFKIFKQEEISNLKREIEEKEILAHKVRDESLEERRSCCGRSASGTTIPLNNIKIGLKIAF
jgi:hypothetical protein